ncbi:MAG TPA: NAD-dependent epimerase/dehydratase family protein [Thermodesulfobacteriota bacterium]|nr:NAD-dependent epimerase/dehydratase family protein [Thermodesulfobacteriota bacterium]
MSNRVLVTGGTGFIGGNLTRKLVKKDYNVSALVRPTSNVENLNSLGVELCYGDLSDTQSLKKATKDVEIVYHCAAKVSDWGKYEDFYEVNVEGTRLLLDSCLENKVKRFIYLSTTDTVWKYEHHINIDEDYPYPVKYKHPYCETKALSEKLLLNLINNDEIDGGILRPCWVWGHGDNVVLPRLLELANDDKLFLVGKGDNKISICYVDNLTDAMIAMGEIEKLKSNVYFVHDGYDITLYEFLKGVLNELQIDWTPKSIPYSIAYGCAYLAELYAKYIINNCEPMLTRYVVSVLNRNLNYKISRACNELNYAPNLSFNDGLLKLRLWIDSIGGVSALLKSKLN